jgi:DNA-binding CsgD family transcriptional regulator
LRRAGDRRLEFVAGGTITLHHDTESLRLSVFPCGENANLFSPPPVATIVLSGLNAVPASREQFLMNAFGLTASEARVTMFVAQGIGLAEIAEMLHISLESVRTHLKQVYRKTKANSQSKLVRLVLRIPGEA